MQQLGSARIQLRACMDASSKASDIAATSPQRAVLHPWDGWAVDGAVAGLAAHSATADPWAGSAAGRGRTHGRVAAAGPRRGRSAATRVRRVQVVVALRRPAGHGGRAAAGWRGGCCGIATRAGPDLRRLFLFANPRIRLQVNDDAAVAIDVEDRGWQPVLVSAGVVLHEVTFGVDAAGRRRAWGCGAHAWRWRSHAAGARGRRSRGADAGRRVATPGTGLWSLHATDRRAALLHPR